MGIKLMLVLLVVCRVQVLVFLIWINFDVLNVSIFFKGKCNINCKYKIFYIELCIELYVSFVRLQFQIGDLGIEFVVIGGSGLQFFIFDVLG